MPRKTPAIRTKSGCDSAGLRAVGPAALDRQYFLFFLLGQLFDLGGEAVGRLLDLVLAAPLLVLGGLLLLGEGLQPVVGLAPHVADRDSRVLRELAHRLHQLLAPPPGSGSPGLPGTI